MDTQPNAFDDPAFEPVSDLVGALADIVGQVGNPEQGLALTVQDLTIQLPVELRLGIDGGGIVRLTAAPPQRTETSWTPILDSLSIRVVLDDGK